jgi:head-tail adaptor
MSKQILPSNFNRRVQFKRAIPVVDDGGGVSTSEYELLYTTWASIENLSTEQKIQYGLDAFKSAMRVTMRYNTDRNMSTDLIMNYLDATDIRQYTIQSQNLQTEGYKRFQILIVVQVEVGTG